MVELKGKQLLASTILMLLAIGALGYNALPEAYCPLEDKTVKYVHMSDTKKTVTKVFPSSDEGGYSIADDRCQSGNTIGQWIPISSESLKKECSPKIIAYTDNGKYYCTEEQGKMYCVDENLEQTEIVD